MTSCHPLPLSNPHGSIQEIFARKGNSENILFFHILDQSTWEGRDKKITRRKNHAHFHVKFIQPTLSLVPRQFHGYNLLFIGIIYLDAPLLPGTTKSLAPAEEPQERKEMALGENNQVLSPWFCPVWHPQDPRKGMEGHQDTADGFEVQLFAKGNRVPNQPQNLFPGGQKRQSPLNSKQSALGATSMSQQVLRDK